MTEPILLLCERTHRWAIAFRRALGEAATVGETRTIEHAGERLAASPDLAIAVDATAFAPETLLPAIARWSEAGSVVLVLAAPALADAELVFREAGAIHVVYSPRQLGPAVEILRRRQSRLPSRKTNETPESPFQPRLPWGRFAGLSE